MRYFDLGDAIYLGNFTAAVNLRADAAWEPFLNEHGAAVDVDDPTITTTAPDGTATTYTLASTPPLQRQSTGSPGDDAGRVWVKIEPDQAGTWLWTLASTTPIKTKQAYAFRVRPAGRVSG